MTTTELIEFAPLVLATSSLLTASIIAIANYRIIKNSKRVETARLYLQLTEKWDEILPILYKIRGDKSIPNYEEIVEKYGKNKEGCIEFLQEEKWFKEYRKVCNFYENAGVMIKSKVIDISKLSVLITIYEADYLILEGHIEYLRNHYRDDIYIFWNYLLKKYKWIKKRENFLKKINLFHRKVYQPNKKNFI